MTPKDVTELPDIFVNKGKGDAGRKTLIWETKFNL